MIRYAAAVLAIILLLAGIKLFISSHRDERIPVHHDQVILAFGDSLTYGYGANEGESYPAVLQRLLHHRVINDGVPGELSSQGLNRFENELIRYRPRIVILCHGGNDILQKIEETQIKSNLERMILIAQKHNADVVLIAVPKFGLLYLPVVPLYDELAQQYSLAIESDILSSLLHDNRYKSDWIHPNAQGYNKMAEAIEKRLRKRYRFEE